MKQIRDWLYVASFPAASSKLTRDSVQTQAMLQLFEPFEIDNIDTFFIPASDGVPLTAHQIESGVSFIKEHHAAGKTVMVTCGAGISRSVTFSVAALHEIEGLSLSDAYRSVHKVHPKAMPDQVHWESVAEYYGDTADFWAVWRDVVLAEEDE